MSLTMSSHYNNDQHAIVPDRGISGVPASAVIETFNAKRRRLQATTKSPLGVGGSGVSSSVGSGGGVLSTITSRHSTSSLTDALSSSGETFAAKKRRLQSHLFNKNLPNSSTSDAAAGSVLRSDNSASCSTDTCPSNTGDGTSGSCPPGTTSPSPWLNHLYHPPNPF